MPLLALLLGAPVLVLPAGEVTGNLVLDGGLEEWQATGPKDPWWDYLTVQWRSAEFARDEQGRILTPRLADQFYETRLVKPESADVHSGSKALRLKGQFYLRPSQPEAYRTRTGDVYLVHYWAKGEGQTRMYLHVYGDATAEFLETTGKPTADCWSLIEERIQVVGRAPSTVFPRLWAAQEMLIDDVSVVRVIRPDERRLEAVAADLQKRVAFAWPRNGTTTVDGRLDEPAWATPVAFAGFRCHGDQSLLAAVQPAFRVLFDEHALYIGVEVPLPDAPQAFEALMRQPLLDAGGKPLPRTDTFSGRHSVELFLQAPGQSSYRQLVVSLDGYRYDGSGMDRSWNGAWESAVSVADDRWFLEARVPAQDLGVQQVAAVEGWRLNLCCNQPDGASTWAAVGGNFHSPDAFGELIAQDFATWCAEQPARLSRKRCAMLEAAGAQAGLYAERLAALEAAGTLSATPGAAADWRAITRAYAQMDYLGSAYGRLDAEVRHRRYFQ
jgi:hypothetical protein